MPRSVVFGLFALALTACSGDSATTPPSVSSVVLTPASATTFRTVGRTLQVTASARTASGETLPGIVFNWASSNTAVASVSGSGLVTMVGNGSVSITATPQSSTIASTPLNLVVDQLAVELRVTPAQLAFGALGSTRQLAASLRDSLGNALPTAPTVVWSLGGAAAGRIGVGTTGLITAVAVGVGDSVVATASGFSTKVSATVAQVPATVLITALGRDTIETTGVTRAYTATPRDSNLNTIPGATVVWSSTDVAVATVSGTGTATAVSDGTTSIRAIANTVFGARSLVVRRFASVFTLTPASGSITTASGTLALTGNVRDSANTALPITWSSRLASIATVAPTTGTSATATGRANGSTFILMSGGTRSDSMSLSVSGQAAAPLTAAISVGDNFFRSARNDSQNAAVDTIGVGGTVTWTWVGSNGHSVQSLGTPSFASSAIQPSGTYVRIFNATGEYQYDCQVHPLMTGRIVVR